MSSPYETYQKAPIFARFPPAAIGAIRKQIKVWYPMSIFEGKLKRVSQKWKPVLRVKTRANQGFKRGNSNG